MKIFICFIVQDIQNDCR